MSQSSDKLTVGRWGMGKLTDSERYDLLADERRRTVLTVLEHLQTPVELSELATEIVDREGASAIDQESRTQVEIALHHNHLPKMDDLGVVDYDYESHRIDL